LTGEADWVALREVVPSATATTRLNAEYGGEEITVATLLPQLRPGWRRSDGGVVIALQNTFSSDDVSRDLAQAVLLARAAQPGEAVEAIDIDAPGPRLQDILDPAAPFEVTVHAAFDYWSELNEADAEEFAKVGEQAAESIDPTTAAAGLNGAYWTLQGKRPFLRWSLGIEEQALLNALARLHAKRESAVSDGAKYVGAFRALGLIIPVWQLPDGTEADDLTEPGQAFLKRLNAALAVEDDLTVVERRARAGLVARSVTLR
jgi:hypothetical protein